MKNKKYLNFMNYILGYNVFLKFKLFLIIIMLIFSFKNNSFAKNISQTPEITFSIDNTHDDYNILNKSQFNFLNDAENLNDYLSYKIDSWMTKDNDTFETRFNSFLLSSFVRGINSGLSTLSAHEHGHASRIRAEGIDTEFEYYNKHNIWGYYFDNLINLRFKGSTSYYQPTNTRFQVSPEITNYFNSVGYDFADRDLIVSAAGVSIETRHAELINQRALNGKIQTHSLLASYIHTKAAPAFYSYFASSGPGNDLENIAKYYEHKEWDITQNDIEMYSIASLFLSTFTYVHIYNTYNYLKNGKRTAILPIYKGFRLPDIQLFLERGLSYKFITGYKHSDNLYFPVAMEKVFKGDTNQKQEFTLGINYKFNNIDIKANFINGEAKQGDIEVDYSLSKNLNIYGGVINNDIRNLAGMRDISTFKDGFSSTDAYIGFKLKF